eukprot:scaffold4782_cov106-Cylindrotheca_fusiformis.AAC.4
MARSKQTARRQRTTVSAGVVLVGASRRTRARGVVPKEAPIRQRKRRLRPGMSKVYILLLPAS